MANPLASVESYKNCVNFPCKIKHYRIPAPELSFHQPNLAFIIAEVVRDLLA